MNKHIVTMVLVITAAIGLLSAATAGEEPKPAAPAIEGAKIHLTFESENKVADLPDKGLTAKFTGGAPLLVEGKKGKALAIKSEGTNANGLVVEAPGVFSFKQGTLAFWIKPLVAYSKDKQYYILSAQTAENAINVDIDKDGSLYFLVKKGDKWPSPHFNFDWANKPAWQKDQWYHVAITWGPDLPTIFYVDGEKISADERKPDSGFDATLDKIFIGTDPAGQFQADSAIADLWLISRVLSAEEIAKLAK